jgi:prepilin-type N-terminal cleavage/methylation domain-containing protein
MSQTHRPDAKGFSLLELMVVVGVFGLLVAVTIPGVSSYLRATRIKGAANTLAADLRYARSLSSAQRKTYAVMFNSSTYSLVRMSPLGVVRTRTLPRGIACTAPDTANFYAWGLTDPVAITVSDHDRSKIVRLSATGSVSHD